jgi:adenine-specific DNA-methyltransferase
VKDVYKEMLKKHFNQDTLRGLSNEQKHLFYASFQEYCLQHHAHIYALKTDIQKSGDAFKAFAAANKRKGIVEEYQTADGRTTLVYKGGMLSSLRERIVEENGTLYYGTLVSDFWWDIGATPSSEGGVELKAGKKPEKLLKRILTMCTNENDIVLDFFLGSGSTAATALKMKRRFIGIEQLFYGENDSIKRLQNVLQGDPTGISKDADVTWKGGGSFIYAELQKLNETYMEACVHAQTDGALKELLDEVLVKGLISYRFDENALMRIASEFDTLDIEDKKALVRDLLDKNLLYLPLSEIDDEDYAVTELTKKLNHQFHQHVSS